MPAPDPEAQFTSGDGGQVFVPITNKDVWLKLVDLENKVDSLSIKIYASCGGHNYRWIHNDAGRWD